MAYPIPTQERIRDAILADWRNLDPLTDVTTDSDNYIRASGIASAVVGMYQYAKWGINQYFPDSADLENLVRFASSRGIIQVAASSAIGTINFTGTLGSQTPIGTIVQTADGKQYTTTAIGTIGVGGTAAVAAKAVNAGLVGNQPDNTPGTLQAAPPGIDATAVLAQMRGGTEAESLASLLSRVLDRLRQPPAGGNQFDYPRWAREVPGVTSAWGYPRRRGPGTMDVAILSNGAPPSDALRAAVATYIDSLATPYGDRMILAPQQIVIPITATVVLAPGVLLATVQALASTALVAYFATLKPGDTAIRARILTIIADIAGVIDVVLTAPAANVPTVVDVSTCQIPAIGVVTLGL
jgi:uncharacterized phage protein gp47/JayE